MLRVSQLQQLTVLKIAGALSDEFTAAKARLIGTS